MNNAIARTDRKTGKTDYVTLIAAIRQLYQGADSEIVDRFARELERGDLLITPNDRYVFQVRT